MYLSNLILKNFRNYKNLEIGFHEKLNVFVGENAQGKTNVLESIFFSSFLKSHRTNKNFNLIKFGEEDSEINLSGKRENLKCFEVGLKLNSRSSKKDLFLNGIRIVKSSDFIGYIKVVMFSPEDLKIVKESPAIRRKFLDMNLSQIDNKYLRALINYNKVIKYKNSLLKKDKIDLSLLDVYDEQLSLYSSVIMRKRFNYLKALNFFSQSIHEKISKSSEKIGIDYNTFLDIDKFNLSEDDIKNKIFAILKKNRKLDLFKKVCSLGIHKDDFNVKLNDHSVINYSSQGQQRSSVISIKLGVVEIIKEFLGEYPVLLLDDILSELDRDRRNFVLNFIENIQTFITCTELNERVLSTHKTFNVSNGRIL